MSSNSENDKKRPTRRNKPLGTKVSEEVYEKAQKKADELGVSVASVLRAFTQGWVDDEYPTPKISENDNVRAKKRPKKNNK